MIEFASRFDCARPVINKNTFWDLLAWRKECSNTREAFAAGVSQWTAAATLVLSLSKGPASVPGGFIRFIIDFRFEEGDDTLLYEIYSLLVRRNCKKKRK